MTSKELNKLKYFSIKINQYWKSFRDGKNEYFNSEDAIDARSKLNGVYVEVKDMIAKAEGGMPFVSIFGNPPVDMFLTSISSANPTAAFQAMKGIPDVLSRVISYHSDKAKEGTKSSRDEKSPTLNTDYIHKSVILAFKKKSGPFDYSKLIKLLEQLNANYTQGNEHASFQLLKAILNHIPPLLGYQTFDQLTNNFPWSKSHRKYALMLSEWLEQAHDSTHTPISNREDLIGLDDMPAKLYINTILEICNKDTVTLIPKRNKKNIEPKPVTAKQIIEVTAQDNTISWARYSTFGLSFRYDKITINNYHGGHNYLDKITLKGTLDDGTDYLNKSFSIRSGSPILSRLEITEKQIIDVELFVGKTEEASAGWQGPADGMPRFKDNQAELILGFADGQERILKVTTKKA